MKNSEFNILFKILDTKFKIHFYYFIILLTSYTNQVPPVDKSR